MSTPPVLLQITQEENPQHADQELVRNGIRAYNRLYASAPNFLPLTLFARDSQGVVRGGLLGEIGWEWLYIDILWLEDSVRGQGYGTRLLAMAEAEAQERGCRGVYLGTFEFQALPFYQKHGYSIFGVLEDYPPGSHLTFLQKRLYPSRA